MAATGVEILTIGDELIEGRIVDTHSAWISDRLFVSGLQVARHTSVGDDPGAIREALCEASRCSDAVVVCGGLGPTNDDLTAQAAARAFGRPVVLYDEALEHARAIFAGMGRTMPPNNARQARLPEGATLLENRRGTATGFYIDEGRCRLYFLPGVPHELRAMFDRLVLPDMRSRLEARLARIRSIKTFGLGESRIGMLLEDLGVRPPGRLRIQYRAAMPEVHVRLVLAGFAPGDPTGEAEMTRLERLVCDRLGHAVFTVGERGLPEVVLNLLEARGETVATAESCTGGLLASVLTSVPGASRTFLGSVVAYANAVKTGMLGVDGASIVRFGAVSEPVAGAMARGARKRLGSTWAMAITGIAGPSGGTAGKPVGTVYVAVDSGEGTVVEHRRFFGDRDRIRRFAAWAALDLLRRKRLNISPEPV